MSRVVRCGLVQAVHELDGRAAVEAHKTAAIEKHLRLIDEAASRGVQILCLQELFIGPYFPAEQDARWYAAAEPVPDGPTIRVMADAARTHGMVLIVPVYEREMAGVFYNTAAVIDADGTYLGKMRKVHIPHCHGEDEHSPYGFWEKFYFRPGNLGYPVFETAVGRVGVYICYDRHFPEGARALGLNGAEMVFIPSATSRGLSEYLWRIEQVSHAVANGYFVGTINRVGIEAEIGDDDFYGQSYFCDPRGQFIGAVGDPYAEELIVRDMDLDLVTQVRQTWQFYRDRRPEMYADLVRP